MSFFMEIDHRIGARGAQIIADVLPSMDIHDLSVCRTLFCDVDVDN